MTYAGLIVGLTAHVVDLSSYYFYRFHRTPRPHGAPLAGSGYYLLAQMIVNSLYESIRDGLQQLRFQKFTTLAIFRRGVEKTVFHRSLATATLYELHSVSVNIQDVPPGSLVLIDIVKFCVYLCDSLGKGNFFILD